MRPLRKLFAILLFCGFAFSCATPETKLLTVPPADIPKTDQELYLQALQLQNAGHIQEAIKFWNQFLKSYPRSFEARNNLGNAYYASDQIPQSIFEFETALSIAPDDAKVKENLANALKFQSALQEDDQDLKSAIESLVRAQALSNPNEKERIGLNIELLQDKIYEGVRQLNTIEAYQDFLKRYPNSPKNSEDAKAQIEKIKNEEYGTCLECKIKIPEARLEIMPYAEFCTQCLSKMEKHSAPDQNSLNIRES